MAPDPFPPVVPYDGPPFGRGRDDDVPVVPEFSAYGFASFALLMLFLIFRRPRRR